MKEYFKRQLKIKKPLTQEDIDKLNKTREKNNQKNVEFNVGDVILTVIFRHYGITEMRTIKENDISELEKNYEFVRMVKNVPELKRIKYDNNKNKSAV